MIIFIYHDILIKAKGSDKRKDNTDLFPHQEEIEK